VEIQAQSASRLHSDGAVDSEAAVMALMLFEPARGGAGKSGERKTKRQGSKKKK
jgi:hypothetical protein